MKRSWLKYYDEWRLVDENSDVAGTVWLDAGTGGWHWRVYLDGNRLKTGTGCLFRDEAQREVMAIVAGIDSGVYDGDRAKAADRAETEKRLLAARAKQDTKPTPWGYIP